MVTWLFGLEFETAAGVEADAQGGEYIESFAKMDACFTALKIVNKTNADATKIRRLDLGQSLRFSLRPNEAT